MFTTTIRRTIEASLESDTESKLELYYNLHRVIEFEKIYKECLYEISQTCEAQINFWSHLLSSNTVDLNVLDRDGERIYKHAEEAGKLWERLCEIHPNHSQARHKYAAFQREIRNNEKMARELKGGFKGKPHEKAITMILKNNEVLFSETTAVVHVSGSKDSIGKILKMNKGATTVFGFTPQDLLNNTVNKIMPGIFAKRHNDLMIAHFKTGKSKVFRKERNLFGLHKDGYCMPVKLLVKPIPKLDNGCMHYVGMGTPAKNDNEYILTDPRGVISCMTDRLAKMLGVSHSWVSGNNYLNVVLLAPELLDVYYDKNAKKLEKNTQKFKEIGGIDIALIAPKGLESLVENSATRVKGDKRMTAKFEGILGTTLERYNLLLNKRGVKKNMELNAGELLDLEEYKTSENRCRGKCRVFDLSFIGSDSKLFAAIICIRPHFSQR